MQIHQTHPTDKRQMPALDKSHYGLLIQQFILDQQVRDTFRRHTGNEDWDEGGCYALARALQIELGEGILLALGYDLPPSIPGHNRRIIGHVVLAVWGKALDGRGFESVSIKLRRWSNMAVPPRAMPFLPGDEEDFFSEPAFINALQQKLHAFLRRSM